MSKFHVNIFLIPTISNYFWASTFSKNQGFKSQFFSSSHAPKPMNNETLVVFLYKNWFLYHTTRFKVHFQRNIFLKIDLNLLSY